MRGRGPSTRWTEEHGFRASRPRHPRTRRGGKLIYTSWWKARIACWRINRKLGDSMQVYSCYWGADYHDGETAEKHYHLGHQSGNDMWGY